MAQDQASQPSDGPRDANVDGPELDAPRNAQGAPNEQPRERGSRADDPAADSILPGREFGAGGQIDDGPDETAGAGTGGG